MVLMDVCKISVDFGKLDKNLWGFYVTAVRAKDFHFTRDIKDAHNASWQSISFWGWTESIEIKEQTFDEVSFRVLKWFASTGTNHFKHRQTPCMPIS